VRYQHSNGVPERSDHSLFERLETRTLLAGNVMGAVGMVDEARHHPGGRYDTPTIPSSCSQLASGQWQVTGSATRINSGNFPFTTDPGNPPPGNIVIQSSAAAATRLKISNGNVSGALLINAGRCPPRAPQDGNENVQVSNVITGLSTAGDDNSLIINLGKRQQPRQAFTDCDDCRLFGQGASGRANNSISLNSVTFNISLRR